ncbi:MAG TPA: T9SS type A sorting domain-containing protein [Ignavibacteriaceae bacterium]|nr:T9SS type A sorting domain-containing protein [Ignavibacteriaceae bacterium]
MKLFIYLVTILALNQVTVGQYGAAPLKMGNYWVWLVPERNEVHKSTVIDTGIIINDKQYYKIENVYPYPYSYNRYDNDDSLYYDYNQNTGEFSYYKKECKLFDSWQTVGTHFVLTATVQTVYSQINVFGEVVDVKQIYKDLGGLVTNTQFWTDEFGLLMGIDNGSLSEQPYYVLKGCFIDGVVYGDTNLVDVEDENYKELDFKLYQNYPNPFNPKTTIEYELKEFLLVSLKVYDVLGKEIATLVNEEKPSGRYSTNFNGKGLSSGIYYYKLTIGGNTQIKKMILLQ